MNCKTEYKNGATILISYTTPVAAIIDSACYVTEQKFSVTTSTHINKFVKASGLTPSKRPQKFFADLANGVQEPKEESKVYALGVVIGVDEAALWNGASDKSDEFQAALSNLPNFNGFAVDSGTMLPLINGLTPINFELPDNVSIEDHTAACIFEVQAVAQRVFGRH